jgi:hypothetical protein
MNRKALGLSLLTLAVGVGSREGTAQITPLGWEDEVDNDSFDIMNCPQVAVAPDRSFEIAWAGGWADFHPSDVMARHYAPNGSPTDRYGVAVSPESFFPGDFLDATALALTPVSTGFRVLYTSDYQFFRRKIDAKGVPAPGGARPVGTSATQIILPGPGETVFAGQYDASRRRLSLQQVDSLGKPAGTVYVLNTRPIDMDLSIDPYEYEPNPLVRPLSDGGWVAVFGGTAPAAPGSPAQLVIRARRFNAAGLPLGPDFDIATSPVDPTYARDLGTSTFLVAALPGGRFTIVWEEAVNAAWSLRMRSFNAAGVATGPVKVVVRGKDFEGPFAMAADNNGRLLLTWLVDAGYDLNPLSNLWARLFLPDGTPVGPPVLVNTVASDPYNTPDCGSVAWTGDTWLITWHAWFLEDLSAVFLRRFR